MVPWWGTDSYFNNEQIQIGDIEIMNSAYGSSGSFVSRIRSKYIGHNAYTGRRSNFCSKPTHLFQKASYAYKKIDTVMNEFSPNDVSSHLHICDHSIVKFDIIENCLGFPNTSHVESLNSFRISAV